MSDHFNGLRPDEAERLAMLAEECGEVVQAIGKVLRHGYESTHPDAPAGETNRQLLRRELTDLFGVFHLMAESKDQIYPSIHDTTAAMYKKLRYAHHQEHMR